MAQNWFLTLALLQKKNTLKVTANLSRLFTSLTVVKHRNFALRKLCLIYDIVTNRKLALQFVSARVIAIQLEAY